MQLVRVWFGKNRTIVPMIVSIVSFSETVCVAEVLIPAHQNRSMEVSSGWRQFSFNWNPKLRKYVDAANDLDGGYLIFREGNTFRELTQSGEPGEVVELLFP